MARKIKSGKAKTWPLEYGEGQGPRPGDHTLPPLKVKGKKKTTNINIWSKAT